VNPPAAFAPSPARDGRFEVKDRWSEMVNLPEGHPDAGREFLHRQLNEELNSLEMAARNLVDFPEADWNLRLAIARQCSDEARHAVAFRRLLEARGGSVGEFPVLNFQYRIITAIDTLIGRLAVANRGFEASGIDAIQDGIDSSRKSNDAEFIQLFDAQLADEVQHVLFANSWIRTLITRDGPRAILAVARAVAHADMAFKQVVDTAITYPVAEAVRREAGFTDEEIATARVMAGGG
jgi:uncharacterized ferritin-like protein (DUF455 family)